MDASVRIIVRPRWITPAVRLEDRAKPVRGPEDSGETDFHFWAALYQLIFAVTAPYEGCHGRLSAALEKFCNERQTMRLMDGIEKGGGL